MGHTLLKFFPAEAAGGVALCRARTLRMGRLGTSLMRLGDTR
jgi:2-keto-3-deoxy-6-phosphogluconate aldolase